jgi:hypothetical protein
MGYGVRGKYGCSSYTFYLVLYSGTKIKIFFFPPIPHPLYPFFPFAGKPLKGFWVKRVKMGEGVFIHYTHIYI